MSSEVPSMGKMLSDAALCGKVDELKVLLLKASKGEVNFQDPETGETALIKASEKGSSHIVSILLSYPGINVNLQDKYGWTALIKACHWGSLGVVQLLLAHPGIDVNAQIKETGFSALILAAAHGRTEVVKMLLEHPNVYLYLRDNEDNTALEKSGNHSIKRMIQAHIQTHGGSPLSCTCTVS